MYRSTCANRQRNISSIISSTNLSTSDTSRSYLRYPQHVRRNLSSASFSQLASGVLLSTSTWALSDCNSWSKYPKRALDNNTWIVITIIVNTATSTGKHVMADKSRQRPLPLKWGCPHRACVSKLTVPRKKCQLQLKEYWSEWPIIVVT